MPKNYNKRDKKRSKKNRSITKRKKRQFKQKSVDHSTKERQTAKCLRFVFGLQMKSKVQMTTKDRNRGTQVYEQSEIEQDTEGSPESDSGVAWGPVWLMRGLSHRPQKRNTQKYTIIQKAKEEPPKKISILEVALDDTYWLAFCIFQSRQGSRVDC